MELHRLGKYEIVHKIGQGAMGEVYKAHDPILNRDVAIKTMSAAIGADDELRKRFHREAQSAARLNHPNIITVYDFGEEQGKIYMAMELLEGNDLKDLIGRHTPHSLDQKLGLMEQIAEGLAFAHAKDVVHRDLKPANIHIQPNGQIKIMDFGLAKLASSDMTRAGMIMGTPNYMSPEQVRGEKADSRSDVFSLGAVFYELLANRKPFEADSLHAVLFQVMQNEPEALLNLVPDVPPLLAQVVEKAMAKDSALRFRDAGELRDALRQVRAQMSANWSMAPQPAPQMDQSDATVIGAYRPGTQAPALPTRPPQSMPPMSSPGSWPPNPGLPGAARPAYGEVEATTLQQRPPAYPTPVPGAYEAEATTLQPPPAMRAHPPTPVPGSYDVEATTLQQRPHPGTPLPVARPVPPPRVEGQLAYEHQPTDVVRAPTLSGHAPTHVPQPAPPLAGPPMPPAIGTPPARPPRPTPPPVEAAPRAPRPSSAKAGPPMPVLIGGGVLVLALAVGGYLVFRDKGDKTDVPGSTVAGAPDPALVKQLLDSQAIIARKQLEDKDYRGALAEAEKVLAQDPSHGEAKAVQDGAQKALRDVEAVVKAIRDAMDANDMKAAAASLSRLFVLDPNNPAAAEFSSRLNQFFKSQAETARKESSDAQRQADRQNARSQPDYGAAGAMAREAEALFGKNEFAQATRRFAEARDAYDRARRAALRPATPLPTLAPATTMAVEITQPPTTVAVATPTPAPTPAPGAADEAEIRVLAQQFQQALQAKDPGQLKTLKPDLSGKEADALRRSASLSVTMRVADIDINGDSATAMLSRTDGLPDGKTLRLQQTLVLAKRGGRWIIVRMAAQPIQ
jgi:serine/threonine protein kinase/tetratricopeptide (TPR) repeat protein